MSKIILVTGGARSGKSTFAENLAAELEPKQKAYIATAQVLDDEMAHRVNLHRIRRAENWRTFEAPFNAKNAIDEAATSHELILFDCLTIYLSNLLCSFDSIDNLDAIYTTLHDELDRLIYSAKNYSGTIIFVTNEVGFGIVPENKLARIFRDCQGFANQAFAAASSEVYLIVSGIHLRIK